MGHYFKLISQVVLHRARFVGVFVKNEGACLKQTRTPWLQKCWFATVETRRYSFISWTDLCLTQSSSLPNRQTDLERLNIFLRILY